MEWQQRFISLVVTVARCSDKRNWVNPLSGASHEILVQWLRIASTSFLSFTFLKWD